MFGSFTTTLKIIGFILVSTTLLLKTTFTIVDPDYAWHVRVGEYIWQEKTIPRTDLYSFSVPDAPYVYHSWLSEVVFYLTERSFGLYGVSFLLGTSFLLAILFLHLTTKEKSILTLLLVGMFVTPLGLLAGIGMRIQTFTFLFLTILHFILLRSTKTKKVPDNFSVWFRKTKLIWLIPLFILWANIHGGFVTGLTFLFIFIFGVFVSKINQVHKPRIKKLILFYFTSFLLITASTLINPYFIKLHFFTWKMVSNLEVNIYNNDWTPVFANDNPQAVIITMLIFFWSLFLTKVHKKNYLFTSTAPLLVLLNFASSRFLLILIVWIIPYTVDYIVNFSKKFDWKIVGYLTFVLYLGIAGKSLTNFSNFIENYSSEKMFVKSKIELLNYSYEAHEFIKTNKLPANIFNNINWGGYLQWYYPDIKIFADSKMDNYYIDGKPFVSTYYEMSIAEGNWQEKLDSYQINTVYVPKHYPIALELEKSQAWEKVFGDDRVTILVRKEPTTEAFLDNTFSPIKFRP